jgi:hypothetical protein
MDNASVQRAAPMMRLSKAPTTESVGFIKWLEGVFMACEHCTDPDGDCCYPIYGVGPHTHVGVTSDPTSWIGSTVALPQEQWPDNYQDDPDCLGFGTWRCPKCGEGKPSNAEFGGERSESAGMPS